MSVLSREDIIDMISQLNEYVNEIAGGFTLFLHQDASADIGGYLLLATDAPDDIKTDVGPFVITGDDQELEQFATAAGEPGLTTLQHGVYELHFHAEKTAGTKNAEVYFKIYKRAAGGAETLLGTSEVTSAIGSGESEYSIHTSIIEQILLVDDRIVLKLFGSPVGLGSNPTISVYVEGVTLSRLTIPVGIGDIGITGASFPVGSANAEYIVCMCEGGLENSYFYTQAFYGNTGANDGVIIWGIPLPLTLGSKKLYVNSINVGLKVADAGDYLTRIRLFGWTAYDAAITTIFNDATDKIAAAELDYDFAAEDMSSYRRILIFINFFATNVNDFQINYVRVKYYYDT